MSKSSNITPYLQSNCLLNTGLWKSYDDYIFSTTSVGYKDAEKIFGLKVPTENPGVWDNFIFWEVNNDFDSSKAQYRALPLHHDGIRAWLHRLFLSTVLPADRDTNSMLQREERPLNVSLFLVTLSYCVQQPAARVPSSSV
jgi:hypothetical protein